MTDIVVVSLEAWDDIWRRNQHLLAQLLRDDAQLRVLFVEPAVDPLHAASRRHRPRRGSGLRPGPSVPGVAAGRLHLYEPTKWLPRRVDRGADTRQADAVVAAAERLGFRTPLLWVNAPSGATLLARTGWPALYDVTDDWLLADRSDGERARLAADEALLLERCAEVVVCSEQLARTKSHDHLTVIPNAVDTDAYRHLPERPRDLPTGPVAVYVGTVHTDRMDLDLCVESADRIRGTGTLALVGPVALEHAARAALLRAGVVLLGAQPFDTVPAYLRHADLLVVPHLVDPFTRSLDPIKVYEYQAARRPVLSTPVAGFRELAGRSGVEVVDRDLFADRLRDLLGSPARADDVVEGASTVPTWRDRAAAMREVIGRVAARRPPATR